MKVFVRSIGPLAEALGGKRIELDLPCGADVVLLLEKLAKIRPDAGRFLGGGERRPVQVFRDRRSLGTAEPLSEGDEIDLVVAVAGG